MAWSTPITKSTGDLVSAADWNTNTSDNMLASTPITKGSIIVGNATAPAELTVGSNGQRLEADSAEATGLKWVGGPLLVESQTLSGAVATITFTSIPGIYNSLELHVYTRSDASAASDEVILNFNNDTGNNYDCVRISGREADSLTVFEQVGTAYMTIGTICGNTSPADAFDLVILKVPNYAGAVGEKVLSSESSNKTAESTTNLYTRHGHGWWRSTAAITEIDLALSSAGDFMIGSSFSLYGL